MPQPWGWANEGVQHQMRRMQLFEFEDQPWLPGWVRDALTDHLADLFLASAVGVLHDEVAERLAPLLDDGETAHILDLCSGAGGPVPAVVPLIETRLARTVTATLTDRYPHGSSGLARAGDARIQVASVAIDARSVPPEHDGVRTIFNAIHHFSPPDVARVLRSTTAGGRSVAVFEPFERTPRLAARLAAGGVRDGWRIARRRHDRRARAIVAHLILPIVLGWDGAVSVVRGYRAQELLEIAREAAPEVCWSAERVALPWGGLVVLLGRSSQQITDT